MTDRDSHSGNNGDEVETYQLHVSKRYLELTEEKLKLTRLPREPSQSTWDQEDIGVNTAQLEPLLDFWAETYDFRAQERFYNNRLPQYRVNVPTAQRPEYADAPKSLRIHFAHRRSTHEDAIPLLFCHGWGSSFIEPARIIGSLCEPSTTPPLGNPNVQAFHVVCPSIPGFGYSDMSTDGGLGVKSTAEVFHALMIRLGYTRYVAYGSQLGFRTCMATAQMHPHSCMAVYTSNPDVPAPAFRYAPLTWLKYRIARLTRGRLSLLSFGYLPFDFSSSSPSPSSSYESQVLTTATDPRVLSIALADSPSGLLAFLLNLIRPNQAPFPTTLHSSAVSQSERAPTMNTLSHAWTPSDLLTWTMLYWLPGPEAPLNWLYNALLETTPTALFWRSYTPVPLGVTCFRPGLSMQLVPPMWAGAYMDICWLRRHESSARWPAWEKPEELVVGLRDFVAELRDSGRLDDGEVMEKLE